MAGNPQTRKFPTLTEIVEPSTLVPSPPVAQAASESRSPEDRVEAVIRRLSPSLELELRRSAHALLDVQLTAILPDLHRQIERLVRQAMEEEQAP